MLDVSDQQLLVLLLVVQAEFQQLFEGFAISRIQVGHRTDQRLHALIHVLSVPQHFSQCRPADQAALMPWVLAADSVVIAVEEHAKAGIVGRKVSLKTFQ
jgi:hypothetical protein